MTSTNSFIPKHSSDARVEYKYKILYGNLWLLNQKFNVNKDKQSNKALDYLLSCSVPSLQETVISNKTFDISSTNDTHNQTHVTQQMANTHVDTLNAGKANDTPLTNNTNVEQHSIITSWDTLESCVGVCTKCKLHHGRRNTVLERGSRNATWMFVGEAPGENEDKEGKPFVGVAGELLNKMIAAMKLDIENDVYICNVVKCRPPFNRNPEDDEIASCSNYLDSQINLVKPKIIITLGRFASMAILKTNQSVGRLRGIKTHKAFDVPVVVTYHPAYLLRNPDAKADAWSDLKLALKLYEAQTK